MSPATVNHMALSMLAASSMMIVWLSGPVGAQVTQDEFLGHTFSSRTASLGSRGYHVNFSVCNDGYSHSTVFWPGVLGVDYRSELPSRYCAYKTVDIAYPTIAYTRVTVNTDLSPNEIETIQPCQVAGQSLLCPSSRLEQWKWKLHSTRIFSRSPDGIIEQEEMMRVNWTDDIDRFLMEFGSNQSFNESILIIEATPAEAISVGSTSESLVEQIVGEEILGDNRERVQQWIGSSLESDSFLIYRVRRGSGEGTLNWSLSIEKDGARMKRIYLVSEVKNETSLYTVYDVLVVEDSLQSQ